MDRIIHAHRKLQYNLYNLLARDGHIVTNAWNLLRFLRSAIPQDCVWTNLNQSEPIWTNLNQHGALESSNWQLWQGEERHWLWPYAQPRSSRWFKIQRSYWRPTNMESGGMGADPCLGMLAPSIERELSMYDGVRMVSGVRTVSLLQVRVPLISFVHRFSVVLAYVSEMSEYM